jgi:hypothetical protein
MFLLADRFGWTPLEIMEQPAYLLDWMLAMAAMKNEIEAEQRDR